MPVSHVRMEATPDGALRIPGVVQEGIQSEHQPSGRARMDTRLKPSRCSSTEQAAETPWASWKGCDKMFIVVARIC